MSLTYMKSEGRYANILIQAAARYQSYEARCITQSCSHIILSMIIKPRITLKSSILVSLRWALCALKGLTPSLRAPARSVPLPEWSDLA